MGEIKRRALNLFVAADQLLYVVMTLGHGSPDETMSSAAWRTEQDGKVLGRIFRPVIDFLFRPLEADHCHKAFIAEVRRLQFPALKHLP